MYMFRKKNIIIRKEYLKKLEKKKKKNKEKKNIIIKDQVPLFMHKKCTFIANVFIITDRLLLAKILTC